MVELGDVMCDGSVGNVYHAVLDRTRDKPGIRKSAWFE